MPVLPLLRIQNNLWHQLIRGYRKRIQKSKTLDLTPVEFPSIKPPLGVRYSVENRNPRNLEFLRIAYKNEGWPLENEEKEYWHKLEVVELPQEVRVSLRHIDGNIVLSASTKEWCIRKHLFKGTDKSAYMNIGRVFARRCLESGFNEIACTYKIESDNKLEILLKQIQEAGVILNEPSRMEYEDLATKAKPERSWDVTE